MSLVTDGVNGFIVSRSKFGEPDVEQLKKALSIMIANAGLRQAMGAKSREIAKKFSWDTSAEKLLSLFETHDTNKLSE
jgi:glycosyltransferase involved in cell wall biosynthesis